MKDIDTIAVRELELYITNDADLYRQMLFPIITSMQKKYDKGTYDHDKALISFKRLADMGAKKYSKDFSTGTDGLDFFSSADRKEVAKQLADNVLEEMKIGA